MYQIDAHDDHTKPLARNSFYRLGALTPPVRRRPRGTPQGITALRVLDWAVSLGALLFFLPLMLAVALLVWLQDGGPVFFAQRRVGLGGRTFKCFKFRTMVIDADKRLEALLRADAAARFEWETDHKLRKDPRITGVGEFLRKSSLDELPQLINVLRGEMSVVGPRPVTEGELVRYGRWVRHYYSVLPGMTGLWQVSGRNEVDYRRRVALDVLYVRNRSLANNIKILFRTIPAVLLRSGAR